MLLKEKKGNSEGKNLDLQKYVMWLNLPFWKRILKQCCKSMSIMAALPFKSLDLELDLEYVTLLACVQYISVKVMAFTETWEDTSTVSHWPRGISPQFQVTSKSVSDDYGGKLVKVDFVWVQIIPAQSLMSPSALFEYNVCWRWCWWLLPQVAFFIWLFQWQCRSSFLDIKLWGSPTAGVIGSASPDQGMWRTANSNETSTSRDLVACAGKLYHHHPITTQ